MSGKVKRKVISIPGPLVESVEAVVALYSYGKVVEDAKKRLLVMAQELSRD